jgi:hypothetical protein
MTRCKRWLLYTAASAALLLAHAAAKPSEPTKPVWLVSNGKQRQAEIRRGIEDTPDKALVFERLKQLREYPWSSYRA